MPGLLRRSIDIAFTRRRIAVFMDGCFWHGCPVHGSTPRSNAEFWSAKIEANRQRDRDTDDHLKRLGWTVLRFWEHENPDLAVATVMAAHAADASGSDG